MSLFSTIKPTEVKAFPGKPRSVYTRAQASFAHRLETA